jgi:YgiT-type zinc finger domain-containing protein
MNDRCNVCEGRLNRQNVTYTQFYEGQFMIIEHVPAWVCEQCGEVYYDPEVVDRIQHLIWSGETPARMVETPVYEFER